MPGKGHNLDDIRRSLRRFRFDPKYRGNGNRVNICRMAEMVGIARSMIYDIMLGRLNYSPSEAALDRLRYVIDLVENKGLRWTRAGAHAPWVGKLADGSTPHVPPSVQSPRATPIWGERRPP